MKILISGATGFIGRQLVPALKIRGHTILIHTRNIPSARKVFGEDGEYMDANSDIPSIDGVIHLAGESVAQRWTKAARKRILDSRVEGARNLINRTKALPIQFFISASAIGYYGSRGNETLTESSSSGSGFLAEVCRKWESELLERSDFKVRKAVLRTAPVLGRQGGVLAKMLLPFRLGLGGKIGDGMQWMSWIHIEDIVAMYVRLAEDPALDGIFIGAAAEPVTNAHFTKALGRELKRPTFLSIPTFALKVLFGEMSTMLTGSQRVLPRRFLDLEFTYRFRTIESALHDLLARTQPRRIVKKVAEMRG